MFIHYLNNSSCSFGNAGSCSRLRHGYCVESTAVVVVVDATAEAVAVSGVVDTIATPGKAVAGAESRSIAARSIGIGVVD